MQQDLFQLGICFSSLQQLDIVDESLRLNFPIAGERVTEQEYQPEISPESDCHKTDQNPMQDGTALDVEEREGQHNARAHEQHWHELFRPRALQGEEARATAITDLLDGIDHGAVHICFAIIVGLKTDNLCH